MSRHPRSNTDDPTAERTADSSTQTASGLGTPRPGPGVERNRQPDDDPVRRTGEERDTTPRRYEQTTDDAPVMPAEDSSLNTKI